MNVFSFGTTIEMTLKEDIIQQLTPIFREVLLSYKDFVRDSMLDIVMDLEGNPSLTTVSSIENEIFEYDPDEEDYVNMFADEAALLIADLVDAELNRLRKLGLLIDKGQA